MTNANSSYESRAQASSNSAPFDLDATEEFILYRCGAELTGVISEVFQRLREAEAGRDWAIDQSKRASIQWNRDLQRIAQLERIREAADRLAGFLTIEGILDDHDAFDLLLELEAELGTIGAHNKEARSSNDSR